MPLHRRNEKAAGARSPRKRRTVAPARRQAELNTARGMKMARSAHAYVRGSTAKFYEWLDANERSVLPQGPAVWICGDCHIGNLGPVANANGQVAIQIRDFDQTVIGNPAHDLVRLGLSLAMAVRSSDLPGVTTALMMEQLMVGYRRAFQPRAAKPARPEAVHIALKQASRRTWRHLAEERVQGKTVHFPMGARFWPVTKAEKSAIGQLLEQEDLQRIATKLSRRSDDAPVDLLDVAYWKKGCSSLGKLRFAAMLDVGGRAVLGRDLCLVDIKEAARAAAPRYQSAEMPHEYAQRVVEGARHLSPHLGERMVAGRLWDRSVFVRELLPEDMKLELDHISAEEARQVARYLAHVVGVAHARQMSAADKRDWAGELNKNLGKSLEAPSWLWNSVVDLVGVHERAYLDHCRRYALESSRRIQQIKQQPA